MVGCQAECLLQGLVLGGCDEHGDVGGDGADAAGQVASGKGSGVQRRGGYEGAGQRGYGGDHGLVVLVGKDAHDEDEALAGENILQRGRKRLGTLGVVAAVHHHGHRGKRRC